MDCYTGGKTQPLRRCISCGGTGFYEYTNGYGFTERKTCADCHGTGYMGEGWGY